MTAFAASLFFVTLAEMGDKTQLLAMAFATRFPAPTILAAVLVATLLNHALAVAAGRLLTTVIPLEIISFIAALSFILFGLWTIRGDALEGEDQRPSRLGPFLTVAIAFFLAELGDKTQLATISLAVTYERPIAVLLGTTTGMVLADGFGIILGCVLGTRLPDALIRLASAGVFIGFGILGAGAVLPTWLPRPATAVVLFAMTVATLGAGHVLLIQRRRFEAYPQGAVSLSSLPRRGAQLLFAVLLLLGWMASLGMVTPLAAVDHWVAFALLMGLGWKLIHTAVRRSPAGFRPDTRLFGAILALAAITSAQAVLTGFPLALAIVPVTMLLSAVAVLVGGSHLRRRVGTSRLQWIGEHRVSVAAGLMLIGMALKTLIEHLA